MIQAMYSGISGMKAFKSNLDVIGNNIANVNTVGYKASRATFKELMIQTLSGASAPSGSTGGTNPSQVGLGVMIGAVAVDGSQGSMQATGRQTDLGIEGNGFFAVSDGQSLLFTRDGAFTLDAQNNLVSVGTGLKLLGWTADPATGVLDTSEQVTGTSSITIPVGSLSLARQTTLVEISSNLDASTLAGGTKDVKFDVFDSLGVRHAVRIQFTKMDNPPNWTEWQYDVYCADASADPAVPVATGTITFDDGGHSEVDEAPISLTLTDPNGSVSPLDMAVKMSSLSFLAGENTADMTYQDGLPLGTLESFGIDRSGTVFGTFTNGSTRQLGQVALATFTNSAGLSKVGGNLLTESPNSGTPQIGLPGGGSKGMLSAGFLEASNVDLANEFANMIVAQRGFQANARIISAADEVLQELVMLRR